MRMGSLSAARRKDSRATDSEHTVQFETECCRAGHCHPILRAPLPLPIRVSGGRAVTDLSGKMRIQSLPLRFMFRVSATRAASICVLVIQARSSVCSANAPKSIRDIACRLSGATTSLGFAILHSFWHQRHGRDLLVIGSALGWAPAAIRFRVLFSSRFGVAPSLQSQHLTPILP